MPLECRRGVDRGIYARQKRCELFAPAPLRQKPSLALLFELVCKRNRNEQQRLRRKLSSRCSELAQLRVDDIRKSSQLCLVSRRHDAIRLATDTQLHGRTAHEKATVPPYVAHGNGCSIEVSLLVRFERTRCGLVVMCKPRSAELSEIARLVSYKRAFSGLELARPTLGHAGVCHCFSTGFASINPRARARKASRRLTNGRVVRLNRQRPSSSAVENPSPRLSLGDSVEPRFFRCLSVA